MGLRKSQGLAPLTGRNFHSLPDLNNGTKQKITQILLGSRTESNPGIWLLERRCTTVQSIMVSELVPGVPPNAELPFFAGI